jgi:magnesium transporter
MNSQKKPIDHMHEPARLYMRTDVAKLERDWTVGQALEYIRGNGIGERIIYFYVVDGRGTLLGVLPARRLLTSPLESVVGEMMLTRLVTVPEDATVFDVCEFFVLYKLLALPIVDSSRRILGVVDVSSFARDLTDLSEAEQVHQVFETIGYRVSQIRSASPLRAFLLRFPWLLATIASGTVCALIAGMHAMTLAESLVLAFFLTLVLGLGESVSMQTLTVTIQALQSLEPTVAWYLRSFWKEFRSASLVGIACGVVVGAIILAWKGDLPAALVIGSAIAGAVLLASLLGLTLPSLLHALRLDLRIAAGPVTLALADISTLLIYFTLARTFL